MCGERVRRAAAATGGVYGADAGRVFDGAGAGTGAGAGEWAVRDPSGVTEEKEWIKANDGCKQAKRVIWRMCCAVLFVLFCFAVLCGVGMCWDVLTVLLYVCCSRKAMLRYATLGTIHIRSVGGGSLRKVINHTMY